MRPFLAGLYAYFENRKGPAKQKQAKNLRLLAKNMGVVFKIAAFSIPRNFPWGGLKIEIYTAACDRPPFEETSITQKSGVGIGRILVINGWVAECPSLEVGDQNPPAAKGIKF